jgi:LuxR family transcriptional regulator of csgAB operon
MGNQLRQGAPDRGVIIVGANSFQNKLLAKLIDGRTGYACEIQVGEHLNGFPSSTTLLVLLDAAQCAAHLPALCASGLFTNIALINADDGLSCEQMVGYPGVKGVFCAETSEEQLIKGIKAIFNGEYWLPRRVLCAHLERTRIAPKTVAPEVMALTRKEMETLTLLARGNTTDHIAHELNVSPHTVKTHIYNLFRKIHVSNRVQAVHWASRNLVIPSLRVES